MCVCDYPDTFAAFFFSFLSLAATVFHSEMGREAQREEGEIYIAATVFLHLTKKKKDRKSPSTHFPGENRRPAGESVPIIVLSPCAGTSHDADIPPTHL